MAVTVTQTRNNPNHKQWTIIKTADADASATIVHGFLFGAAASTPRKAWLAPLLDAYYITRPFISTEDATNVIVTLGVGVGSGVAGAQIRVIAELPHSITE